MKKIMLISLALVIFVGLAVAGMKMGKDGAWLLTDKKVISDDTYEGYQNQFDNSFYLVKYTSETYRYYYKSTGDYDFYWSTKTTLSFQTPQDN